MIHAIVTTWAFDKAKTREESSRRCPKCHGEPFIAEKKVNEPVACEKCGTEITPKASAKQEKTRQNDE